MHPNTPKTGPYFIIFAAILWAVDGILLRPSFAGLPVALVILIESAGIALVLAPLSSQRLTIIWKLGWQSISALLGVGILGGAIGTMAITTAIIQSDFVNISIVLLIQKLQPVFAIILAGLLLKENPQKSFYGWAFLAFAGSWIMTFGLDIPAFSSGTRSLYAALYATIAAISFGASTVLSKRVLRDVDFGTCTWLRFLISTVFLFFVVLAWGYFPAVSQVTHEQIGIFFILIFVTSGPAILIYYYGLKRTTASAATIYELAFPLTAILLEYVLLDNMMSPTQWAGIILLSAAILKINSSSHAR